MATYFPQPQQGLQTQNPLNLAENFQKNLFRQQDQKRQAKIDEVNTMRYAISTGNKSQAEAIWKSMYPDRPMPETEFDGENLTQIIEKDGKRLKVTGSQKAIVSLFEDRAKRPEYYEDPRNQPMIQSELSRKGISFEDVTGGGKASAKTEMGKLLAEQAKHQPGTPAWNFYEKRKQKIVSTRPTTQVNVQTGPKPLVKAMSAELVASLKDAEGAVVGYKNSIDTKKILDQGMITGTGAEFLVGLGNLVSSRFGFDEYDEPVANAQAFSAAKGREVGQIIKQFGAGTGLSDADREYAEKIVAGKITLNEKSIRKIIDINNKAYKSVIEVHNKKAKKAMKRYGEENLPYSLVVDLPKEEGEIKFLGFE